MNLSRRFLVLAMCVVGAAAFADDQSERAAADLLRRKLANESPSDKVLLDNVKGKDIVVVAGSMDHIEQVLAAAKIPYTMIQPEEVAEFPLRSSQIVMVNCPGVMPDASLARIEKFVRAGGLLYTTDWALANVVQKIFPRTVSFNGHATGDEVVPVMVDEKADNLMSQMLLRKGTEPQWWLEGGSYPIKIEDPKRVQVLAHSKVMHERYGSSPVVVRFRHEDGEVIHVVSHFVRQMGTKGVAVAAKNVKIDGLSAKDQKEFAASEAAGANMGDVESSYAFQRMTTNLVTGKQKANVQLQQSYGSTVRAPAAAKKLSVGARMRVLESKDGKSKVRDEYGNEDWVPAASVSAY